MSGTASVSTTFAAATTATGAQLDGNFSTIVAYLNDPTNRNNYAADSGTTNTVSISFSPAVTSYTSGLEITFKSNTANSGPVSVNANSIGNAGLVTINGGTLTDNQIPSGGVVKAVYDGSNFRIVSSIQTTWKTNSLSGDVALNNTANFFDGPSTPQGTVGTWWASGTVTLTDASGGTATMFVKLWDGTTVIASARADLLAANGVYTCSLSGAIASPAGNIRISVRDTTSTSGKILANSSLEAKDSTLTVFRMI